MVWSRLESSVHPVLIMLLVLVGTGAAAGLLLFPGWFSPGMRLALKPLPVLCMVCLVVSQRFVRGSGYRTVVAVGLLFGATGDVLLELGGGGFLYGLAAFLVGHLCYMSAFIWDSRRPAPELAVVCGCYGALAFASLSGLGDLGDLKVPVAVYVAVICAMVWRAWARLGAPGVSRLSFWTAFVGALLFTASDTLLAGNLFVVPFSGAGFLVLSTYWLGQLGIAASVLPDLSPPRPVPGPLETPALRDGG
jgi:uncharacterized membrane protein YhhN